MKIIQRFQDYQPQTPLALSIGMFDGVHIGHQTIIRQLNTIAAENHMESAILTFWPHPRTIFNPDDDLKLLNTIDEKTYLLQKNGVQHLFLKEFDAAFRNLTGEEFVHEILIRTLNVKHLIVGHDHTFGKNKSGDFALLQKMAPDLGFRVQQVQAVDYLGKHISSTQVRNALAAGNIKEANAMLGYVYSVTGTVVHGKKIGRTIGFPTANIATDALKFLPGKGAYIVEVFVLGERHKGMLSIGHNPTIGENALSIEVYILDFDRDIYGEKISVNFRDFLHEEIKFDGLESLTARLAEDEQLTRDFQF